MIDLSIRQRSAIYESRQPYMYVCARVFLTSHTLQRGPRRSTISHRLPGSDAETSLSRSSRYSLEIRRHFPPPCLHFPVTSLNFPTLDRNPTTPFFPLDQRKHALHPALRLLSKGVRYLFC